MEWSGGLMKTNFNYKNSFRSCFEIKKLEIDAISKQFSSTSEW